MIYELRTYTPIPGRLPDVLKRFETITLGFWKQYGIKQIGFWTVLIGETNQRLIYMLQWESLADREQKWNAFMADKDWLAKRAETEKNGPLLASINNQILEPTSFSATK